MNQSKTQNANQAAGQSVMEIVSSPLKTLNDRLAPCFGELPFRFLKLCLMVAILSVLDCCVANAQPPTSVDPVAQSLEATNGSADSIQNDAPVAEQASQFDGQAAFEHLKKVCEIGPRVSASRGMKKQQKYIEQHFKELGGSFYTCLLYTSPSPRDQRGSRMPSSA